MRHVLTIAVLGAACGGGGHANVDASGIDGADAPAGNCQPIGATGAFYRRTPNPRMIAGHAFQDGRLEVAIADPDLHWDDTEQLWQLYYHGPRATSFTAPNTQTIAHATSTDLVTWTVQDAPALAANASASAWDHLNTETPTVVENPNAPADHRYLLLYSGASGTLPGWRFPAYSIGAAFSADGVTFTRVPAAESPHNQDGLVLNGADVYGPGAGAIVSDPELALVDGTYHLWFSSFACGGTNCGAVMDYGIGHATSTDGVHWTVAEAPVRTLLRTQIDPKSGGSQPSVIYDADHCRWEMWLHSDAAADVASQPVDFNNMAGVWHAASNDAVHWNINYSGSRDVSWMASAAGEHLGLLTGADVAAKSTGRYMVYVGFDDASVPSGFVLPARAGGTMPGVMALNLAARDAPP
jgi:hypothetical protein